MILYSGLHTFKLFKQKLIQEIIVQLNEFYLYAMDLNSLTAIKKAIKFLDLKNY